MSASKLICYFSSHPAAFGVWSLTPPNNMTLTSANRKADQSLIRFADWCWCCCSCHSWHRATHLPPHSCPSWYSLLSAWFWGRHYPCVWSVWFTSQGSWHFDSAVSKWVGNTACILAHAFNSVSRQCHEVWASQFPFLHSLREVIPLSEACLYGCIKWSLVQAQQQSSMGCGFVSVFSF